MYYDDKGSDSLARSRRLMLLAPSAAHVPPAFQQVDRNLRRRDSLLAGLQRLRGRLYLHDGAILPSQLTVDGRHVLPADDRSWHVVSVGQDGEVNGCARYLPHDEGVGADAVGVWSTPLARHEDWKHPLRRAVEGDMALARRRKLSYVEVGGWAITEELRYTTEAMQIALSTYAHAENIGGCIGITTATVRPRSSSILRKIGGQSLEFEGCQIPAYYDPYYRCEMEILRFESGMPNPKYRRRIERLLGELVTLPVICGKHASASTAPVVHKWLTSRPLPSRIPTREEAFA
jgi:hypothetical protein